MDIILISAVFGALLLLGVWYLNWHYTYWTRRGFPQLEPNYFYGNFKSMVTSEQHICLKLQEFYTQVKQHDIELVKNILQKDFLHFQGNGFFNHEKDYLNQHLLALEGERWKSMRSSLTPTFTSARIKSMFELMMIKTANLKQVVKEVAKDKQPCDIKDLMMRYTTDVIVSAAFGMECDSLKDPNNLFRRCVKDLFKQSMWKMFREKIIPWSILGHFGHKFLGTEELAETFVDIIKQTAEARKKENVNRKDFFHYLMQIKKQDFDKKCTSKDEPLSYQQMAAQSFLFYVGGYETTATTMSFALLNMALHPDYQQKCRDELNEVLAKHDGKITYEAALMMTYMDQCILESMRHYPPFGVLEKKCNKKYTIPATECVIEKGTKVIIPVRAIQMDPEIFPSPEIFNPENFSKENKQKRPDVTFLAFGDGPRQCIGMRFGLLNAKVGIATILKDYNVKLSSKMQLPVEIDSSIFVLTAKGDIWLNLEALSH